jgi:hypothetical protein
MEGKKFISWGVRRVRRRIDGVLVALDRFMKSFEKKFVCEGGFHVTIVPPFEICETLLSRYASV